MPDTTDEREFLTCPNPRINDCPARRPQAVENRSLARYCTKASLTRYSRQSVVLSNVFRTLALTSQRVVVPRSRQ